jgi:hypothetical protein
MRPEAVFDTIRSLPNMTLKSCDAILRLRSGQSVT